MGGSWEVNTPEQLELQGENDIQGLYRHGLKLSLGTLEPSFYIPDQGE
jgi:hypothetical protein